MKANKEILKEMGKLDEERGKILKGLEKRI